ncbi:MAG: hypothetical protein JXR10_07930 [Cyclobacteriaceae bacterium]
MDAYNITLHAHSGLRWIALLLALVVVIKSIAGLVGKSEYSKLDNILGASYVGFMHLQLLLGLVLYFVLSPITEMALNDFGAAMKNSELRFWAVEHLSVMLLAIIFAQIGRTRSKKADISKKYKLQAIFFGASLLLMLAGIPWGRI